MFISKVVDKSNEHLTSIQVKREYGYNKIIGNIAFCLLGVQYVNIFLNFLWGKKICIFPNKGGDKCQGVKIRVHKDTFREKSKSLHV